MPAKFQKRHYLTIAETLHSTRGRSWDKVVEEIAAMFARDNLNFQGERFVLACEEGINAKGVGAGIQGGPAMPYFQGNTPMSSGVRRAEARMRRNR